MSAGSTTTGGTRRRFWVEAPVPPSLHDRVWRAWTDPAGWEQWDLGLRHARLTSPGFTVGAVGEIVDLGGRISSFTVTVVAPDHSLVRVEVALPGAQLVLTRSTDLRRVRHEVAFAGPLSPVFSLLLGGGFRTQVGPSLDALLSMVQGDSR